MSENISICSRCRKPLSSNGLAITLEKELRDSIPQVIELCPNCIESFEWWYRKHENPPSTVPANDQTADGLRSPSTSGSNRSKRRHRKKKRKNPLIRMLTIASLTIVLFLIAFYWTWTILTRATRVDD